MCVVGIASVTSELWEGEGGRGRGGRAGGGVCEEDGGVWGGERTWVVFEDGMGEVG